MKRVSHNHPLSRWNKILSVFVRVERGASHTPAKTAAATQKLQKKARRINR